MSPLAWAPILFGAAALLGARTGTRETVPLASLDLAKMTADWGRPQRDRSVEGNPLSIGGRTFEGGVGTHANSVLFVNLGGAAETFRAFVGCDDESGAKASVEFEVLGDGRTLWTSGTLRGGDAAKEAVVDVRGVERLVLLVTDAGDGIDYDHADWAEARIEGARTAPRAEAPPREEAVILTPAPPREPRIHGPRVYGVRPGRPLLYRVPATGDRPLRFEAVGLPAGLTLDPTTGIVTGKIAAPGTFEVTLRASNDRGSSERALRIVCGDTIALTPPMGWNSWNCFAHAVTRERILEAAEAMVASGLADHGWSTVNIDDYWTVKPGSDDPTLQGPARDDEGNLLPNPRFPDMRGLCDAVHALGLKIGIYSSPGPLTCGGCVASHGHETKDARSFAAWGIDYLKYDWCSYGNLAEDGSLAELMKPYRLMREALDGVDRDIVYSLCQYGMGNVSEWGAKVGGNCWRTTGDIFDTWGSVASIGFGQAGLEAFAGPGRWNDPDMLVVGWVGWGPDLHPTRLTPNEQYAHVSLWCLLSAPLLLGCDLTRLDAFTLGLLTNDEVLEVNQDPLGRQAARVAREGRAEVWAKAMEDGSRAVGLFNRGELEGEVTAPFDALAIDGKAVVRDLWRQTDLGEFEGSFTARVPRHGVVLVRVRGVGREGTRRR